MQEKVLQIEIKNDIIKFHRKKRLDKNILETPKKQLTTEDAHATINELRVKKPDAAKKQKAP